jgi:hypothetical protein
MEDKNFVFALAANPSQLSSISTENKIITYKTARSKVQQATQIPRNIQTIKFQIDSTLSPLSSAAIRRSLPWQGE